MQEDKKVNIDEVSVSDAPVSDAAENIETESVSGNESVDECANQIDDLNAQIAELNEKFLRTAAELENTRRRAALDCESAARTRAMNIARHFLPVMDAVQAALKHNPDDAGIVAMARAMDAAFEEIGIKKIESVGNTLNPAMHNAIQVIDAPGDGDTPVASNTILEEMQTGYMFGDTVLRTAMVVVAK